MAFDWREYLSLAHAVQGQSGSGFSREAGDRCAVSRAYYAALCHVRNRARERLGFSSAASAEDHIGLAMHLRRRGMPGVARRLGWLRQWRNACDYREDVPDLPAIAEKALARAREVLDSFP